MSGKKENVVMPSLFVVISFSIRLHKTHFILYWLPQKHIIHNLDFRLPIIN